MKIVLDHSHLSRLDLSQVNFGNIEREVKLGFISSQSHPDLPLRILNYTQSTQFQWRWNAETLACRGLIVDSGDRIVARPFAKFFSYEQLGGVVPQEPFEAFEKLDGSLGILYQYQGQVGIASRGSFVSEQAVRASKILLQKYRNVRLDHRLTYLFEIIYPANRIVVDYAGLEDLILLAVIDTETGLEQPLPDVGFPIVKRYDGIQDFAELLEAEDDRREGFVVRFESGQRVKIKFSEYRRLHKLLTGITPKHIWEYLRDGRQLSAIIERVPDEYYDWIREVEARLQSAFNSIEAKLIAEFNLVPHCKSRREYASHFQKLNFPAVMFAMLDNKPYAPQIWKMVKTTHVDA